MTEIKLNLEAPATWLHHLRAMHDETGTSSSPLSQLADQIEEQIKPAVEEPTEFGSIIRALSPQDAPATAADLWMPTPRRKHYWMSQSGLCEVWSELSDVEVLRVGVGDEAAYNNGVSDTVSALVARLLEKRAGTNLMQKRDAFTEAIKITEALS